MDNIIIYNYITTNLIDGKQYVGKHCTKDVDDGYLGSGKLLLRAIKKYGKYNFKRDIICFCNTEEEAQLNEEKFIIEYNTLKPNGYNISPNGGRCGKNFLKEISEETKEKLRAIKGNKHWAYGKKQSEETKNKHRQSMIGKNKGKKLSKETIEKIYQTKIKNGTHKQSEESKEKIRNTLKGRVISNETREKLKLIKGDKHWAYGKKCSEESRKKRSETFIRLGLKPKITKESIEKVIQTKIRNGTNRQSEETKLKISMSEKGRKFSNETREKLRQAAIRQWDRQLNRNVV